MVPVAAVVLHPFIHSAGTLLSSELRDMGMLKAAHKLPAFSTLFATQKIPRGQQKNSTPT